MGPLSQQELTADELLLARAEANGYQRGAHREADEVCGRDKHVSKTKKNQDATLRRYILWRLSAVRKEHAQKGLSPPNEETARRQYLGQNVTAPDLVTVKDFLRFYIATSKPQLDKEAKRPTADSINIAAEWFFAGFTRVTGTDTDKEERSEVYNWVRQTLTREGIVVNKHRPKHNFTDRDLSRVLLTLWTRDDLIFVPERYRVQTTFIIHVYCWTGARIGAFFTHGLRYKDITLVLQRVSDRSWRLIYKVDQRWVKNNRDPENIVFGAAAKGHERLFYNDAGFLLAMAIADNALFGYESLEDVRAQEIPLGKDELVLRFKDSALERPILRKCTKTGGVAADPMPKSSFTAILKSTLINAGYLCGPSIHAIRRQLGKEVDKRYTSVQRSQHLTQADERVFGQSYVANCSSVDGQAAFRNEESDHRHIEYFQSMEKFHEEGLPDKVPAHLEADVYRDPQLRELEKEMQTLARTEDGGKARSKPKRRYANRLKKLKIQALRQYQEHWVRERRDWKILTRGKEAAPDKSKTDFVQSICLLIPERGRLAQNMAVDNALEPGEMWQALQDLYTLCVQDFTVLYLPKSRPVDGACPVKCCQLRMDRLPKQQRNQHIQFCVRVEMANRLDRLQSDIHYCYLCFDWVVGREWERHCQTHLVEVATKVCGTVTYCHTLIRPGYCPFCMSKTTLPASQRLASWTRDRKLWDHVNDHTKESRWPCVCPHPLCDTPLKDAAAFHFHLMDDHGFSPARPVDLSNSTTLPRIAEKTSWHPEFEGLRLGRKRKSSSDHGAFEWTPPESFPTMSEPMSYRSPKRCGQISPTICPQMLCITDAVPSDQGAPDDQPSHNIPDSATLLPSYSPGHEGGDQCSLLGRNLFPSYDPTPHDTIVSLEPEDAEDHRSDDDDILFNQYLHSPSPSPFPSPDDAASTMSAATLVDVGRAQSHNGTELDAERPEIQIQEDTTKTRATRDQEDTGHVQSGLRVRLRVSQPKITLRLRLQATSQPGKERWKGKKRVTANKGKNQKNKKGPKSGQKGKAGKS